MDRVIAVQLAVKCMQHLEAFARNPRRRGSRQDEFVGFGHQGAKVVFGSMKDMEMTDTDWKARRPKDESWLRLKATVDILSGRPRPEDCCEKCGKGK